MDRLLLEGMTFFGRHGALEAERELGQRFTVDADVETDIAPAAASDHLLDAIDYRHVYEAAREVVEGEPCNLLETVAERIASRVLELTGVRRVTVRVRKKPPLDAEFRAFGVEVTRSR